MSDTAQTEGNKDESNVNEVALAEANMANAGVSNINEYEPMNNDQSGNTEDMQDVHINIHLLHQTLRPLINNSSMEDNHGERKNSFGLRSMVFLLVGNHLH